MTDIRRTILWVVFATSLFMLWDAWNTQNGHPSLLAALGGKPPVTQASQAGAAAAPSALPAPAAVAASGAVVAAAAPSAAASAGAPASQLVTVTTDVFKATLDTRGGDLVRVELLQAQDADDKTRNVVLFDHSADRTYLAQTGLVGAGALPNHTTVMTLLPGERELKAGVNELKVALESPVESGVKLVKTYTFRRNDYAIGVHHDVVNTGGAAVSPQLYLRLVRDGKPLPKGAAFTGTFTGPAVFTEKLQTVDFEKIDKGTAEYDKTAQDGWVAIVQHYFASIWVVPQHQQRQFSVERIQQTPEPLYAATMVLPLGSVAAGATKGEDAVLYVGPTEEARLKAVDPSLEYIRNYGWTTMLARPLFWLLSQLHSLIGNWGWAIVALVVVLKIAFYWLNASAYRSMAKMKAINPRVMELRERLKDKPQQMQQEMMRIYREEKVNPLGGCLPILVQMPFFIALYSVLLSSVEMRHAPWLGWIMDLSSKDPYYILPLLMTASTLLQTWLNPTPPDPVQAKMMWIMPLAFSVMFFSFPSGLVLYWLTNNILSIAQQWLINRQLGVNK